jgi:hypothetical protein
MSDVPALTSKVVAPPSGAIPFPIQTDTACAFRDLSARYADAAAELASLARSEGEAREADRQARETAAAAGKPIPTDEPHLTALAEAFAAQELAVGAIADATRTAYSDVLAALDAHGDSMVDAHVTAGRALVVKIDAALEKIASLLDEVDHNRNMVTWITQARDANRTGFPWLPSSTTSVQIGATPVARADAFHAIRAAAVVEATNEYAR